MVAWVEEEEANHISGPENTSDTHTGEWRRQSTGSCGGHTFNNVDHHHRRKYVWKTIRWTEFCGERKYCHPPVSVIPSCLMFQFGKEEKNSSKKWGGERGEKDGWEGGQLWREYLKCKRKKKRHKMCLSLFGLPFQHFLFNTGLLLFDLGFSPLLFLHRTLFSLFSSPSAFLLLSTWKRTWKKQKSSPPER